MKLYHLLEQGDRIQAGDEFYSIADCWWKPVSDDIRAINEGAFPVRRAVPGIWHLAGERRPTSRDADRMGRVLAIDAGGTLMHILRSEATEDEITAWCRTADFLALCPPPEVKPGLPPCPFCGGRADVVAASNTALPCCHVACVSCGARTTNCVSPDVAIHNWTRRPEIGGAIL